MILSADQILAADDIPVCYVDVPEWGPSNGDGKPPQVRVKALGGVELEAYHRGYVEGAQDTMVRLCAACMVDEAGQRLFSDAQLEALGRKSGRALRRIWETAQKLNGLGEENLEALAKNS